METLKRCPKCRKKKPATVEHFQPRREKNSRDKLSSWCRVCLQAKGRERMAKRRADPKEKAKLLEEKRRYATSEKGKLNKRLQSEVANHRRRQRHLALPWDWSPQDWLVTKQAWAMVCAYCGGDGMPLEQDHFIPLSHPECPGTHPGNIVPACPSCNLRKGQLHPLEWLEPEAYARIVGKLRSLNRL